jgi:hypothetical protein
LTLSSEKVIDNNAIKEYQRKKLARSNSNHCSIELMPLPCRSVSNKDWFYNQFKIDYLSSRKSYLRSVLPLRIKSIKEVITKYKPRIVIFYSFTYLKYREEVIGNKFIKLNRLYHYKQDDINYFIIPHPTAYGIEKQEWIDIAESIKALTV